LFSIYNIKKIELGIHEKEFIYFVSLIPNKGVILDIGANIGIMTAFLASRLDNAMIYSFEPISVNLIALEKVLKFFGLSNVKLFKTALGDKTGELKMIMPLLGGAKMQGLCHVLEKEEKIGEIFKVPVFRLDDLEALKGDIEISAIKIDVENFEYFVLSGGRELLLKHKPIIYSELLNTDRRALCINYLKELGYSLKVFRKNKLTDFKDQYVINFFFFPSNYSF
jgi:FkbM family methyltransferase